MAMSCHEKTSTHGKSFPILLFFMKEHFFHSYRERGNKIWKPELNLQKQRQFYHEFLLFKEQIHKMSKNRQKLKKEKASHSGSCYTMAEVPSLPFSSFEKS